MSVPPDQFSRLPHHINLRRLRTQLVVVVGVGTVGSAIAEELANTGVGRLRLIDGNRLKQDNVSRHVLRNDNVGENKAASVAALLNREIHGLTAEHVDRHVDRSVSDEELDGLLEDSDLIVVSTDDRSAQRRVAERALALDTPAVLPGLYQRGGGEVFVQLGPTLPCFSCWDGFRSARDQLRGVAALRADTRALTQIATELCVAVLDPGSEYARRLAPTRNNPRPQLFVLEVQGFLIEGAPPIQRRPGCPGCRVGPPGGSGNADDVGRSETTNASSPRQPTAGRAALIRVVFGWVLLILVFGVVMSLAGALLARHRVGMPGDVRGFLPMVGYLLQISAAAGAVFVGAVAVTEALALRRGEPGGRYGPSFVIRRRAYLWTAFAVAVALYVLAEVWRPEYRFLPFSDIQPYWWWIIGPIALCLTHVVSLMRDRWRAEGSSPSVLLIPMSAALGAVVCGLVFAWLLPMVGSAGESTASISEPTMPPPRAVPVSRLIDTHGIGPVRIGMSPEAVARVLGRPFGVHHYSGYWVGWYQFGKNYSTITGLRAIMGVYYGRSNDGTKQSVARSLVTNSSDFETRQDIGVGDYMVVAGKMYRKENRHEAAYFAGFEDASYVMQSDVVILPPDVEHGSMVYEYSLNASGGERLIFTSDGPYSEHVDWVGAGACCTSLFAPGQ